MEITTIATNEEAEIQAIADALANDTLTPPNDTFVEVVGTPLTPAEEGWASTEMFYILGALIVLVVACVLVLRWRK